MHLKSLTLKNFKSYADTTFDFELITSVVGRNGAGKTNVYRALKLLLHHGDWPAGWIRYGQDSASIELTLTNGTVVTRKRTKTNQSVTISTAGKVEVFEGKKDATEFIEKAVGIKKVTLDETTGPEDLNFVDVYDGPYLVGGRSDTVQRKVAGIVGANKIDDARSRILKQVKSLDNQVELLDADIAKLSPIVTRDTAFLQGVNQLLQYAEKLDSHWQNYETELQELYNLKNHLDLVTSLIPTANVVQSITDIQKEIKLLSEEITKLTSELTDATLLYQQLSTLPTTLDLGLLIKAYELVKKLSKDLAVQEQAYAEERQLLDELKDCAESIVVMELELKTIEIDLQEIRSLKETKLKELGICPLCGTEVS